MDNPPPQGRKAAFARDRGLSALPSLTLIGLDRPLAFATSTSFTHRFCLHIVVPKLCSERRSVLHGFADSWTRPITKRPYYTERGDRSHCQ